MDFAGIPDKTHTRSDYDSNDVKDGMESGETFVMGSGEDDEINDMMRTLAKVGETR